MNPIDMPRPLTDDELSHLLAPVPLERQQREALVRISLRPGLPVDYAGPVELDDLRLALSPWHWLKHELVVTPNTAALNQLLAEAQAAGESLDTVAEIATWIADGPFDEPEGRYWESAISSDYYGHNGVVSEYYDTASGSYLPPLFELQEVIFLGDDETPDNIVVAQVEWGDLHPKWAHWLEGKKATGPASIFALAKRRQCDGWLINADQLWLTDSTTGETFNLDPHGQEAEWNAAEQNIDEAEEDNPEDWNGNPPTLSELGFGLRYEAGQLYRADTKALLTIALPRLESAIS